MSHAIESRPQHGLPRRPPPAHACGPGGPSGPGERGRRPSLAPAQGGRGRQLHRVHSHRWPWGPWTRKGGAESSALGFRRVKEVICMENSCRFLGRRSVAWTPGDGGVGGCGRTSRGGAHCESLVSLPARCHRRSRPNRAQDAAGCQRPPARRPSLNLALVSSGCCDQVPQVGARTTDTSCPQPRRLEPQTQEWTGGSPEASLLGVVPPEASLLGVPTWSSPCVCLCPISSYEGMVTWD